LHGLPALLKDCSDPPLGLYVRSSSPPEEVFRPRPSVAVVGTRDVSRYGLQWCRKLTGAIAQSPARPVIVSGLAIGVDIAAHLEAIDRGGSTIAVLPTGLDKIYPYRHEAYADRICNSPGSALVSDYPPGTMALKTNFLRRNRIIAG
ncbi:MAG: DNA-processing protein DprA, partial [Bacteroidales bacterium]|nr:DNA-processing protein DprA [Bacteroidales bacterium]